MGSLFGNIARGIGGAVMTVARSPVGKMVPYAGTALSVLGAAGSVLGGSGSPSLPSLPGMPGMPKGGGFAGPSALAGDRGWFQNDPNVPDWMKPAAISKTNLKVCYRAPKGYVIRYDEKGDPYGIPRQLAKQYLGWKPAKKPLLSIRDTNAIRQAGRAIKKLQNAEKMAKKIANWKSPTRSKQIFVTGGVVGKSKRIAA
jgi:hypothetical protein